jgi:hypothetical protein
MLKIIFIVIAVLHGLIHLLGFAKSFELAEVKQLSQPISKSAGIFWLIAFVLFILTTIHLLTKYNYWWLSGLAACIVSQILIFLYWQDAKFGTIANIIILIATIIGYGTWSYYRTYQNEVKTGLQQKYNFQQSLLTEEDIQQLPELVKKYLRYTGSIGKPKVNNFKILFLGKIRKNEQSEWMTFASEQYNFMKTPVRLFFMNATMKSLPVTGYHKFINGNASMDIRLFSLIKVQYMDGPEMNKSETVTFFNDMCCMAPPTLIDKRITWTEVRGNMVKANFTNNNISISASLFFNDQGELINFISNDRYDFNAKKILPWSTPLKNYRKINGYMLPSAAKTIYTYPEGDFCYGTFEAINVEYNCLDEFKDF